MSLLTLLSSSYKSTPALLNDKRWTQEQTRELLEIVGTSEVRTAPATHRHQMWAELGKQLSTPRTAKETCNKYHQVCSSLKSNATSHTVDEAVKATPADSLQDAVALPGAVEGDVLDQAIADNVDDSVPRRLAFASPAPVNGKSSTLTSTSGNSSSNPTTDNTTTSSSASSSSSSSPSSATTTNSNKEESKPTSKTKTKNTTQTKTTKSKKPTSVCKPTSVRGINIGDTVMVDSRTWPGMNKPGGAGRVTSFNANSTFNIKYMLGGSERSVDPDYVHKQNLTGNAVERKRGRRTFYDPVNNEAVVTDDDGIIKSKKQEEDEAREKELKEAKELAAKETAKLAVLLQEQKEADAQKLREKAALTKKNRAAAAKRNRMKAKALKAAANAVVNEPPAKKKRKRSNSRSRSHSVAVPSISAEERDEIQWRASRASRASAMSLHAREMELYIAPTIQWPLPPTWMDATGNRPTLFQAANFVVSKGQRIEDRQQWLASIMTRD